MIRSLSGLALRNLSQHRLRTGLSVGVIALGTAMTIASDMVTQSILNAISGSQDVMDISGGLVEELGSVLTLVGVAITATAGFLVFNAFAMTVARRRWQIGVWRALGCTRRQVMGLVLTESLVTGAAGTLLGVLLGPVVARGTIVLMEMATGKGTFVFGESRASALDIVIAAVLGMAVTVVSVLSPAWDAAGVSPLAALRTAERTTGHQRRRRVSPWTLAGSAAMAALWVYLAVAPPGEWVMPPWDIPLAAALVICWLASLVLILPGLIGWVGRWTRPVLMRLGGATGRLVADNVRRGRGRVTLTVLTLALGLAVIVGLTGFMDFSFRELMMPRIEASRQQQAWLVIGFEFTGGMDAYGGLDSLLLSPEAMAEVHAVARDRALVIEWYYVVVPELGFFNPSYFSLLIDPQQAREAGDWLFEFTEGGWETALPPMEAGCGVLIMPIVAESNDVSVGDRLEVTGPEGPVQCTVGGIGSSYVGASIIGSQTVEALGATQPMIAIVSPLPGADREALGADLADLADRRADIYVDRFEKMAEIQAGMLDAMPLMLNGLLLLAIAVAALGVVNTMVMSIIERRRELGLLRAVGATRGQVRTVVAGEAALMGLVAGVIGLAAGLGCVIVIAVAYGGNGWGVPDLDLWAAAGRAVRAALPVGLVGLAGSPVICAAAAAVPARALLSGSPIEVLGPS